MIVRLLVVSAGPFHNEEKGIGQELEHDLLYSRLLIEIRLSYSEFENCLPEPRGFSLGETQTWRHNIECLQSFPKSFPKAFWKLSAISAAGVKRIRRLEGYASLAL